MDAGGSGPETISVLIKTPNQVREDQVLEDVHLSWTVRDLKTRLSAVYVTKPAVSDQRLIYSGKLLPDHLHMRDIFRKSDLTPALHLVCAYRTPPQEPPGLMPESSETARAPPSSPRPSPSPSVSSTVPPLSPPELRQRRQTSSTTAAAPASPPWSHAWPPAAMPGAPQITQPMFPTYSLYSPQQLLWLQHVYARQYYMQYHAAMVAAGSAPPPPASVTGQFPPVPAHQVPVPAPLANQNPIDNPAQDAAFINPGEANQNMRMNAQGGAVVEDEDAIERDWLDWMYSAARLGVLLMIVYFNSNLSRFLMVASTLLLMYLHTAGLFPFRRQQAQDPNHLQAPEVQHNQQNENRIPNPNPAVEPAEGQREEPGAAEDRPDGQGPMAAVLVPPHRVSVIWTAWLFFKTFFSSLVPEAPRGLAN